MADEADEIVYPPKAVVDTALVNSVEKYQAMYNESIKDPEGFWGGLASASFHWETKWERVLDYNFDLNKGPISIKWFSGARTNLSYNALDRHVAAGHGDRVAIIFEGNEIGEDRKWTYSELHTEVCRVANWLRACGVKKGSAVGIYLPMIAELAIAVLACARIGAVHCVIFGGFSAEAVSDRIQDCQADVIITADATMRGPKPIPLKGVADKAIELAGKNGHVVKKVLVYRRLGEKLPVTMTADRDVWWQDAIPTCSDVCEVEWMDAEDPLFLLYTSGSTGKPKGILHTTGGYMVYAATTFKYVFDYKLDDVYFCTADIGWVTGHSYVVYGPLINCATVVIFEGVPNYPEVDRFWDVCEKFGVTIFYTAPTAIRSLMKAGEDPVRKHDLSKLRILGTVGEPINPEVWKWYHEVVGGGHCSIVDTWWQTETGGHMITPLPGAGGQKPGSAMRPFFGVEPAVLNDKGEELSGECSGYLVIKRPWPSCVRSIYADHARMEQTYFALFKGYYLTGDGCRRDADGCYWLTGRIDDVINVSGHRIGTAEVESAIVLDHRVAEAAVVGYPHDIKGEGIYVYATLKDGVEASDDLKKILVAKVREVIGAFAAPDVIHWAPGLPKTRSGKIMRRILRKIAHNEADQLGDISTLADPSVVQALMAEHERLTTKK